MAVHVYKNISKTEIDLPTESGATKIVPDQKYVGGTFYSFLQDEPAKWEHTSYADPLDVTFIALVQSTDMISYVRDVFGYSRIDVVPPASINSAGDQGQVVLLTNSPSTGTNTAFACVNTGDDTDYPFYEGEALGEGNGILNTFAAPTDLNTSKDYTVYVAGVALTRGIQGAPEDYYLLTGNFIFTAPPANEAAITIDYFDSTAVPNWITTTYSNVADGPNI